jgi:hypothetical protein
MPQDADVTLIFFFPLSTFCSLNSDHRLRPTLRPRATGPRQCRRFFAAAVCLGRGVSFGAASPFGAVFAAVAAASTASTTTTTTLLTTTPSRLTTMTTT